MISLQFLIRFCDGDRRNQDFFTSGHRAWAWWTCFDLGGAGMLPLASFHTSSRSSGSGGCSTFGTVSNRGAVVIACSICVEAISGALSVKPN